MFDAGLQGQPVSVALHTVDWLRDAFENLQAEFWQLATQFALLAGLPQFIHVHAFDVDQE